MILIRIKWKLNCVTLLFSLSLFLPIRLPSLPHLFSLFLIMRMDAFHSQGNDAHRLSFCDHQAGWWPRKPDRLTVASFNADLYHRERRGEESRAPRSLQFCASTALREMITGNRRIRSRVSAINPRFRFFFSFSSSSFQAVNRRHRRLCANVFRNGGRVTRVTHCQDTIHDSAVTFAFVRGWTEIRGGIFGFDRLKYETRLEMILFLFF